MTEESQKNMKNIQTISRWMGIDDEYTNIICRETLSFMQMILLCQLVVYGISKDVIQRLAVEQASIEDIKREFKEEIMSDIFKQMMESYRVQREQYIHDMERIQDDHQKKLEEERRNCIEDMIENNICQPLESLKAVQDELKNMTKEMILIRRLLDGKTNSTSNMTDIVEILNNEKESFDLLVEKIEQHYAQSEIEIKNRLENSFKKRWGLLGKNKSWNEFCTNLSGSSTRRLVAIYRAVSAGIDPTVLNQYFKCSDEQLELIIYILTQEKSENQ